MHGGIGHVCPYYPKLFKLGYGGLKKQVEEKLAKLGHRLFGNGTLLNMKFSPAGLSGEVGTENLISVIDTYFEQGGMHCQFNVLSRETRGAPTRTRSATPASLSGSPGTAPSSTT